MQCTGLPGTKGPCSLLAVLLQKRCRHHFYALLSPFKMNKLKSYPAELHRNAVQFLCDSHAGYSVNWGLVLCSFSHRADGDWLV